MSEQRRIPDHRMPTALMGIGQLHRAIVDLPDSLAQPDRPLQSRIIFFESPGDRPARERLVQILSTAWCIDASELARRGMITSVLSAAEMLHHREHNATGDLVYFVTGSGGESVPAVGPERLHFARAHDVDLFTTPRLTARLQETLRLIEDLYEAEPSRLKRKG